MQGDDQLEWCDKRFKELSVSPLFKGMEYSKDIHAMFWEMMSERCS